MKFFVIQPSSYHKVESSNKNKPKLIRINQPEALVTRCLLECVFCVFTVLLYSVDAQVVHRQRKPQAFYNSSKFFSADAT